MTDHEPAHARPSDGFSTRAVHAGQDADPSTGAIIPPIYQTSTYLQDGVGGFRRGYEYSRAGNPTRDALQAQLAALEGARFAWSFASGLAAEDALLRTVLTPGDHVVMTNDAYGGTHRLVSRIHGPWGIELTVVDLTDLDAVEAAIQPGRTRVLWVETPSNPLLKVTDVAALAGIAHRHGVLVVVDNTFATPALQQPLQLGADVVVHSTTKYLGGHSDVVGGAVVLDDEQLSERIQFHQFAAGAISGPMDAWLTARGMKTLALRMQRHSSNGMTIAETLAEHPKVSAVYYPGLPSHPGHELAAAQMHGGFGGIVSFQVAAGVEAALELAESMRLFQLAESLGGVESLVCYPSEMTHASVKGTELAVPPDLLRLSVGIEDPADLVGDLLEALDRI